jgi:hypothetical protein
MGRQELENDLRMLEMFEYINQEVRFCVSNGIERLCQRGKIGEIAFVVPNTALGQEAQRFLIPLDRNILEPGFFQGVLTAPTPAPRSTTKPRAMYRAASRTTFPYTLSGL